MTVTDTLDVVLFADTRAAFPTATTRYTNTGSQDQSFTVGQSVRLIVDLTSSATLDGMPGSTPYDLYLRMPYLPTPNEVHLPAQGGAVETTLRAPELAGYALDFAYLSDSDANATWSYEGQPVWHGYPEYPAQVKQGSAPRWWAGPREGSVFRKNR